VTILVPSGEKDAEVTRSLCPWRSVVRPPDVRTTSLPLRVAVAPPGPSIVPDEGASELRLDEGVPHTRGLVRAGSHDRPRTPGECRGHDLGAMAAEDGEPKRWATALHVCERAKRGTAYPGDEGFNYSLNPGEAWAETYRLLDERRTGEPGSPWRIIDPSFYPDETGLAAAERDALEPWPSPRTQRLEHRFATTGERHGPRRSRHLSTAASRSR
jgi:hypothetical protein